MFTPQEIQERTEGLEKAVFGGYSVASVEDLLAPLTEDYAALYKENAVLKSKMKVLVDKLEEYREREDSINRTLLTAQKTADETVAEAQRKSAKMLSEYEQQLRARNQELKAELSAEQERVTLAKQSAAKFISEVEERVRAQLGALEQLKQMDLTVEKTAPETPAPPKDARPDPAANPLLRRSRMARAQEAASSPEESVRQIEENLSRMFEAEQTPEGQDDQPLEPAL